MKSTVLFLFVGLMVGLTNCSKDATICSKIVDQAKLDAVPKTQLNNDIARISNFLVANNINATVDASGLRYVITQAGSGNTPCLSDYIVVNYTGSVLNSSGNLASSPFDSGTGAQFQLSGLILGWQIAFPKMAAGSSATLYVPSGLAYGTSASAKIPANSILVFNVTLTSFTTQ